MGERVLLAGCGYVGTVLGLRLAKAGHEVFGLRRLPGGLPPTITPIAADLTHPRSLAVIPDDLDVVVYAAAASSHDDEAYRQAYVEGVRNVIEAVAGRSAPRRFVFVSSTGVYGQHDGEDVDEDSPTLPDSFSGLRLLEGERAALDSSLPAVVVRFGGIYGPGRMRLVDNVRRGLETLAAEPVWTNRIHRDDAARCLEHVVALGAPAPIYIGVDDEPATRSAVLRWVACRLGVEAPEVRAQASSGSGKRCRNRALKASGFEFTYPTFREGYGALIDG